MSSETPSRSFEIGAGSCFLRHGVIMGQMLVALIASLTLSAVDIAYVNGNIYTVDPKLPRASCVVTSGGTITYVGSKLPATMPTMTVVDLHGATMLPGLTDSHFHISGVGAREL